MKVAAFRHVVNSSPLVMKARAFSDISMHVCQTKWLFIPEVFVEDGGSTFPLNIGNIYEITWYQIPKF